MQPQSSRRGPGRTHINANMPDMLWLLMVTLVAGAVLGTPSLVLAQPDDIAAAPTLVPPESDAASTQPPLVVNTGITPLSDFPKGVLAAMGQSAVPLVQTQAAAIASAHNTSTAQLLSMLERDSDLGIDKTGRLVYVCSITSKNGTLEGGGSSAHQMAVAALADDPEPPIDRAFLLHSRPEVPIKLYLNFRGCRVTGTAWNDASGISTINIAAYDIDGSPTFNAEELTRVVGIWRAVAEDYEPWGIDVTTEWPGAAALQRSSWADTAYGLQVCIGGSHTDIGGDGGAGGIAYVGVFGNPTLFAYQVAFAFQAQLAGGDPQIVAAVVSHEAGHTFGLNHDGEGLLGYYAGRGNWGPIMGAPYGKDYSLWDRGSYPGANNLEDDLAIISTMIPLLPDDAGDAPSAARDVCTSTLPCSTLPGGRQAVTIRGRIGYTDDVDFYRLPAGPGQMTLTMTTVSPFQGRGRGNLLYRLSVRNASNTVLGNFVPTDNLTPQRSVSVTLPANGTYFVVVAGIGASNFPSYASMGAYTLSVAMVPPMAAQPPPPPPVRDAPTPLNTQEPGPTNTTFTSGPVGNSSWPAALATAFQDVFDPVAGPIRALQAYSGPLGMTALQLTASNGTVVTRGVTAGSTPGPIVELSAGEYVNNVTARVNSIPTGLVFTTNLRRVFTLGGGTAAPVNFGPPSGSGAWQLVGVEGLLGGSYLQQVGLIWQSLSVGAPSGPNNSSQPQSTGDPVAASMPPPPPPTQSPPPPKASPPPPPPPVASTVVTNPNVPTARPDAVTGTPGRSVRISILANDVDPTGRGLTITAVSAATPTNLGRPVVASNRRSISWTAPRGANGVARFQYTVSNSAGSSTAQVTVTVGRGQGAAATPQATADSVRVMTDTSTSISVLANDISPGGTLSLVSVSAPLHADQGSSAAVVGDSVSYTPPPGFIGTDTLTYTAKDTQGTTTTGVITVVVVQDPCEDHECAPWAGAGSCNSQVATCVCNPGTGLVPATIRAPSSAGGRDSSTVLACMYPPLVPAASWSLTAAQARRGSRVMLQYTLKGLTSCAIQGPMFVDGVATTAVTCPAGRVTAVTLPAPSSGAPTGESCEAGVYRVVWRVPTRRGCYRIRMAARDGSTTQGLLQVV